MGEKNPIIQLTNCFILRDHQIIREDLWVRDGRIVNPEPIFFTERREADIKIDCDNKLLAPGYIDLQINGAFGYDFSNPNINIKEAINETAKGILKHGVTAFCPTLVTQPKESYHKILPQIERTTGSKERGAANLGIHLEGPFISTAKKGAHPERHIRGEPFKSFEEIIDMYTYLDEVSIITIAPELDKTGEIIKQLVNLGIVVSLGHSNATLTDGERGLNSGASFITHLFNAMPTFHHRDPGLVGLLTSTDVNNRTVYYGIIADGIHTHYTALKVAYKANPTGMVLVTDAVPSTGLASGTHRIGTQMVEIKDNKAFIAGTNILCGSIATMDFCVKHLLQVTGCSKVEAIECATLHPAQVLGISNRKGTLNFGSDADFIVLDDELNVQATFISGKCVWEKDGVNKYSVTDNI